MFDAGKNRIIGLPYGEKNYDDTLSRFHTNQRVTDRRTDRFAISVSRVSVLTALCFATDKLDKRFALPCGSHRVASLLCRCEVSDQASANYIVCWQITADFDG